MADAGANDDGLTWRSLNKEGCEQGRMLTGRMEYMEETMHSVQTKLDRLTWAMVTAAIGFGTAAIMLALNLLT